MAHLLPRSDSGGNAEEQHNAPPALKKQLAQRLLNRTKFRRLVQSSTECVCFVWTHTVYNCFLSGSLLGLRFLRKLQWRYRKLFEHIGDFTVEHKVVNCKIYSGSPDLINSSFKRRETKLCLVELKKQNLSSRSDPADVLVVFTHQAEQELTKPALENSISDQSFVINTPPIQPFV